MLQIEDENKLKKVLAFKTILDKTAVANDVNGFPVTKDGYINMVQEADERISSGNFTTIEDLEKEIEKW